MTQIVIRNISPLALISEYSISAFEYLCHGNKSLLVLLPMSLYELDKQIGQLKSIFNSSLTTCFFFYINNSCRVTLKSFSHDFASPQYPRVSTVRFQHLLTAWLLAVLWTFFSLFVWKYAKEDFFFSLLTSFPTWDGCKKLLRKNQWKIN